mmetsp:Transcript_44890/g.95562  ORF Transcript_44890/g.95562 Transcript_44890/m.95562 type:complete len:968 (+) Transcript_44890:102-3005(+)
MKHAVASAVLSFLLAANGGCCADPGETRNLKIKGTDRNNNSIENVRKLGKGKGKRKISSSTKGKGKGKLPNIVVVMIDDLGWNQVGYHANPEGNNEIHTPAIDEYAMQGIKVDRGYLTPWCGPSRAAFQTGTLAAFNEDATQGTWSLDAKTGFMGGLPPTLTTLPRALKNYARSVGGDYATSYAGKWGLQGTTWRNTPLGAGYDSSRSYPSHSMDGCDGLLSIGARGPPSNGGGAIGRSIPGYWEQSPETKSDLCEYFKSVEAEGGMSSEDRDIACLSQPRALPKLVDQDLLDFTVDRILNHDYEEKPIYHMLSTQLMHTPLAYPQKYDESHPNVDLPDHFKEGKVKPPASNTDMRLATANAMRFVDDIFNATMQAIKDAGQWDDTIVLFTTDNGGAIFPLNANNNYPLRGGKRSIFEGGYRGVQFLAGGWINTPSSGGGKRTKKGRVGTSLMLNRTSDTYVFVQDWAPTFLEMAGGVSAVEFLYPKVYDENGNPVDPMEGNPMWKYVQNSVSHASAPWTSNPKQLPRKVSYNSRLFYDVRTDETYKLMYTPSALSVFFIRKWAAVWPKDNEVIPDFGYISVQPCRPEGGDKPQSCCYFKVSDDPYEDKPIVVNETRCLTFYNEAVDLYTGDENDPETAVGKMCERFDTTGCGPNPRLNDRITYVNQPGIPDNLASSQSLYSLWTQYGAFGPWLSYDQATDSPKAVVHPTTKCVCEIIDKDISPGDVDAFIPLFQTPSICISTTKSTISYNVSYAVPCEGFQRTPSYYGFDEYEGQGVNMTAYQELADLERNGFLGGVSAKTTVALYRSLVGYINRTGHTEWPALAKWPYITPKWNTCQQKKATPVPVSITDASPWFLNSGDGGAKFIAPNMCQPWTDEKVWCPGGGPRGDTPVGNPLQKNIESYDPLGNYVKLEDGSFFYPIDKEGNCPAAGEQTTGDELCAKLAQLTAYINNDNNDDWGMAFDFQ